MSARTRRALAGLALFALAVRLLLLAYGRSQVHDGFYLQSAWFLGNGFAPYEDFVIVAFPFLELLYAPLVAGSAHPIGAASLLSGVAVAATAVALALLVARHRGRAAGCIAGALYATAAPVLAYHSFEREPWTNAFLALAALALLSRAPGSDRRAALGGLLLALALAAKLTAAVGAAALLLELALQRRAREALIAAGVAAALLAILTLLLAARYGGEFVSQVLLFYFFKGEAAPLAQKLDTLARCLDPAFALGCVGLVAALARRTRGARPALLLAGAWLGHYLVVSPSLWDHNAIDLALPFAAAAGGLAAALRARPRLLAAVASAAVLLGIRGVGREAPEWFPHGLGTGTPTREEEQAALLGRHSRAGERVAWSSSLAAVLADRPPYAGEFELEPVARGVLAELRRSGLCGAWARRRTGTVLGVPVDPPALNPSASFFEQRILMNALTYTVPRLEDAVALRRVAVVEGTLGLLIRPALARAGYEQVAEDGVTAYVRGNGEPAHAERR